MTTTPCVGWGVARAHRGQSEVSSAVNMADSLTEPVCLKDFESYAREYLPYYAFEFFAGGANEETTIRENLEAFKRCENMGENSLDRVSSTGHILQVRTTNWSLLHR